MPPQSIISIALCSTICYTLYMETTNKGNEMKIKKLYAEYYEVFKGTEIIYIITKGGTGWNLNEGDSPIKGWIDSFDTLNEAKQAVLEGQQ